MRPLGISRGLAHHLGLEHSAHGKKEQRSRNERISAAKEKLADLDLRLQGPRRRRRSHAQITQRIDDVLDGYKVRRHLGAEVWSEELETFRRR